MSKIHPQTAISSSISASPARTASSAADSTAVVVNSNGLSSCSQQKVFTVWMKSLILGGKGCTVFDSEGQVIFRVDNYNGKSSSSSTTCRVHLMDSNGKVICTLLKKKFRLCAKWEGYRNDVIDMNSSITHLERRPWFCVRKSPLWTWRSCVCFTKPRGFEVIVGSEPSQQRTPLFRIESKKRSAEPACCRIVDRLGYSVAEVKRKEAVGGVVLGDDVLTMTVNQNVDHSLVTGLLLCYYTSIPSSNSSSIM